MRRGRTGKAEIVGRSDQSRSKVALPDTIDDHPRHQARCARARSRQPLRQGEAAARLERHGPNRLEEARPVPAWRKFLGQFADPLIYLLLVAVAISLVGAIVGELPTGAVAGLGARLLAGSYYGQTVQIWAALFMAAAVAALLVIIVGIAHSAVLRRMGARA